MKQLLLTLTLTLFSLPLWADRPIVELETSKGNIVVELFEEQAPESVTNFLEYVEDGHYDETLFHRVIDGFMIQGGGFDTDMRQKPTRAPIRNEADNGISNRTGTLAMARTGEPHSATAQFYINLADNTALDQPRSHGWGYAVFGKVTEGMDVVRDIAKVSTTRRAGYQDVPAEPIVIKSARIVPSPATRN